MNESLRKFLPRGRSLDSGEKFPPRRLSLRSEGRTKDPRKEDCSLFLSISHENTRRWFVKIRRCLCFRWISIKYAHHRPLVLICEISKFWYFMWFPHVWCLVGVSRVGPAFFSRVERNLKTNYIWFNWRSDTKKSLREKVMGLYVGSLLCPQMIVYSRWRV